jgi:hypothetical protein
MAIKFLKSYCSIDFKLPIATPFSKNSFAGTLHHIQKFLATPMKKYIRDDLMLLQR